MRSGGRPFVTVVCLVALLTTAFAGPAGSASRRGDPGGIKNPTHNLAPPLFSYSTGPCSGTSCPSPCYPNVITVVAGFARFPLADTPACTDLVLAAINGAQRAEGARPIVLPSNYFHLSVAEQLFVLTDLERVTRRIPPLVGLVPYLDGVARRGALEGGDPVLTSLGLDPTGDFRSGPILIANRYTGGTSIWSGGASTPAAAMFGWMYDDGWGGSHGATNNIACTSPVAEGCWGHRDNILGAVWGERCTNCLAGAGYSSSRSSRAWATSFAMIFVEPANHVGVSFSWNADVVPHLTVPYERVLAPSP
jgi:hypothetical protein